MISLDMRTILFSHILTDLVCLAVVILLWRQSRKRFQGMEYWAGDFARRPLLLISHDPEDVRIFGQQVIHLNQGHVDDQAPGVAG